jgi:glucan biosynthesis protein C
MTSHTISTRIAGTQAARAEVKSSATTRVAFLDKLKVGLTALVIAHHAGQAYGPTGGQWPIFSPERSPLLGPFFAVNAAFFMGLFFLISGYFVPHAFDRKGAVTFLSDRLRRLGIPLLFWGLLVTGPLLYFSPDAPRSLWQFLSYLYPNKVPFLFAHLWFVAHLLVYAVGYAVWCQLTRHARFTSLANMPLPTHRRLLTYTLLLGLATAFVRIWYPIDRWVTLLAVPAEIAHLPQYLSLFVLGIIAYRGDWLRRLPAAMGMTWLGIGVTAAAARYAYSLGGWRWLPAFQEAIDGLVWCTWEAFICVGLSVGFLALFRERFNAQPGRLLSAMAGAAYAAYIVHVIVVLGIQAGLAPVSLPPFAKFVLVSLAGTTLSFGIGHWLRQLPGAKQVL